MSKDEEWLFRLGMEQDLHDDTTFLALHNCLLFFRI